MRTEKFLESKGYKTYPDQREGVQFFQKRVPDEDAGPLCLTNNKVHLNVTLYDFPPHLGLSRHCEVEITAEYRERRWCKLSVYSLSETELQGDFDKICGDLIAAWKGIHQ